MRFVPRGKGRWAISLTLVAAVGVTVWLVLRPPELERNLERVQRGMRLAEVVALFGEPDRRETLGDGQPRDLPDPAWKATWECDGDSASVIFSGDGHVCWKTWYGLTNRERLRNWWIRQFGKSPPF
jgi:hypothetical protein